MSKTIWIINQYAQLSKTGTSVRHASLSHELSKLGFNVTLVSSRFTHYTNNKKLESSLPKLEYFEGFRFFRVPSINYENAYDKKRVLNWFLFAWYILKLPRKLNEKPNVILYSSPSLVGYLAASRLAKKNRAKLIFEVRDIWPLSLVQIGNYSYKNPFIRFLQWIEDKAYRESNVVISNLKYAFKHMQSRGMDIKKFHWISNGFSTSERINSELLDQEISDKIPIGKFVVGYAGTLGVTNDLNTLIDAAQKLNKYTDIVVVITGDGKEKERLKNKVSKLGLKNTIFIDQIKKLQINDMISKFDVCYLGLLKRPLFKFGVSPNKIFDYLVNAKPVIYAIDSGDYSPISEAQAGVSIPPEDSDAVFKTILELKALPRNLLNAMGRRGRKYVLENYNYTKLAKKLAQNF
jgi:hypothetical protein